MKMLAVDAGNTRIKWGVHDAGRWGSRGTLATADAGRLAHEIAPAVRVDRIVVSNVAGEDAARQIDQATRSLGSEVYWVVSRAEQCGVKSSYADPAQLGPDRWAALIGARELYSEACVIVNAGTTMTVDALSADGIFLGGFIVPGLELMRNALARDTAQLKLRQGVFSFFPDNTGDAIVSGAINALAGSVERMMRYMIETGEEEPLIVLSGGNAPLLADRFNARLQVVDNLVLEGLVVIGASDV